MSASTTSSTKPVLMLLALAAPVSAASGPRLPGRTDESDAPAQPPSVCDRLKPQQTISAEAEAELSAAARSVGMGGEVAAAKVSKETAVILENKDLANAWFTYQTCLLKEAGMIDEATATEVFRKMMGLSPTAAAVAKTQPAAKTEASAAAPAAVSKEGRLRILAPKGEGATVLIDGKPVGKIQGGELEVPVSAGPHKVSFKGALLRRSAKKAAPKAVEVKAGETAELNAVHVQKKPWWFYAAIATVVAAAAVATVVVVSNLTYPSSGGSYSSDTGGY